jgi:hypothetical protein
MAESRDREAVDLYSTYFQYLHWCLTGVLGLTFVWLIFKGLPILQAVRSLEATTVMKVAMVLYFSSWCAGGPFDIHLRRQTYEQAPGPGTYLMLCLYFVVLALMFGILCFFVKTARAFAFVLLAMWAINGGVWWWSRKGIVEKLLRSDGAGEPSERRWTLAMMQEYEAGSWQARRFAFGALVIVIINIASAIGLDARAASYLSWPIDLVFAGSVLVFVAWFEGWMWKGRVKVHYAISTIEWLKRRGSV